MNQINTITVLSIVPHGNEVASLKKIQDDIFHTIKKNSSNIDSVNKTNVNIIDFLPFDVSFCPILAFGKTKETKDEIFFGETYQKKIRDFIVQKSLEFRISSIKISENKFFCELDCTLNNMDFWPELLAECISGLQDKNDFITYKNDLKIGVFTLTNSKPSFILGFANDLSNENKLFMDSIKSDIFNKLLRVFTFRVIHFSYDEENPYFIEKEIEPPVWIKLK